MTAGGEEARVRQLVVAEPVVRELAHVYIRMPLDWGESVGQRDPDPVWRRMRKTIAANGEALFVAQSGDEALAGFAWLVDPKRPPGRMHLRAIGVRPEMRGRGLGQTLLRRVEAKARDFGATMLSGHVHGRNRGILSLVERRRFRIGYLVIEKNLAADADAVP